MKKLLNNVKNSKSTIQPIVEDKIRRMSITLHTLVYPKDIKQSLCSRAHDKADSVIFWFYFEKAMNKIWLKVFKEVDHCEKSYRKYHKKDTNV
jgi:hypothetical protein